MEYRTKLYMSFLGVNESDAFLKCVIIYLYGIALVTSLFPNGRILDSFKLKVFADNNFKFD